jgi:hypothetical protein
MIITLLSMSKKVYEGVIKVNTKRSFLTPLPIKNGKEMKAISCLHLFSSRTY